MNHGLLLSGYSRDAGPSLLGVLHGSTAAADGGTTADSLTALKLAQKSETRDVTREAKVPSVARDITQ